MAMHVCYRVSWVPAAGVDITSSCWGGCHSQLRGGCHSQLRGSRYYRINFFKLYMENLTLRDILVGSS
jgi:hypothetical protein